MTPLFLLFAFLSPARAAFEVPGFELVYSYPVESKLEEPDLRRADQVWPEMIDAAKKTVDIEQFYIVSKPGSYTDATIRAIERAAKRGVKVRFMMEKFFFKLDPGAIQSLAQLNAIPGVDARAVYWADLNGSGFIHAKFMVVDSKVVFIGSHNLDWRALEHIHELGVKTSQPAIVSGAQAIFDHDWAISLATAPVKPDNVERPAADRSASSYLVASPWRLNPPGIGDSESEMVKIISEAKNELRMQNLEYSARYVYDNPVHFYAPIDNALRDAALRGVKVELLLSNWSTGPKRIADLKALAQMPNVTIRVITIPDPPSWKEHVPFTRTVHSKYMVVDGKTLWIGTSDWEGSYLDRFRNVELVIKDETLAKRVVAIHEHLWGSPYTAPLDLIKDYPEPRR